MATEAKFKLGIFQHRLKINAQQVEKWRVNTVQTLSLPDLSLILHMT